MEKMVSKINESYKHCLNIVKGEGIYICYSG